MISKTQLKQAWRQRHRHLSQHQEHLRQAAFDLVRAGGVATEAQLAERTLFSPEVIRDELAALEQQGLIVCDTAGVVGIYGLSLVATPHHFNLDGCELYTWCALVQPGLNMLPV